MNGGCGGRLLSPPVAGCQSAMDRLPMEALRQIISYLDLRQQLRLSAVCSRWRTAVSDCLRRRRRLHAEDLWERCPISTALRALLPRLPALRELLVDDKDGRHLDIDVVSWNCPHLEKLDLRPFRLDTDSLERLCRRCPRLWDVRMPPDCSSDLLDLLLHRLPGLRALFVESSEISKTAELLFPDGLERLTLDECQLTGSLWLKPDRWPRLTELVLSYTANMTNADVLAALVQGCPRLQSLAADWSSADDELLRMLPALPLVHLNIGYCEAMTEDGLANCLGRLHQLQSLDITAVSNVTDRVLESLAGAESLRELTVGENCDVDEMDYMPMDYTIEAVRRLVWLCPSLMVVKFNLGEKRREQLDVMTVQLLLDDKSSS